MSETYPPVYVVDDDLAVRESVASLIRSAGLRVETFKSAQEFLVRPRTEIPGCLVLDVKLPGLSGLDLQQELAKADLQIPIIFLTGHGDIPMSVRAMKSGAFEFFTKPFDDEALLDAIRQAIVVRDQVPSKGKKAAKNAPETIVGTSAGLKTVLNRVASVAPTESTVLILGETGTGKELVAHAIHARSQRSSRPVVSVNCAAIQPSLIASELFGHEKGAFTGALQQRRGRFELAEGGTLFLDEVGDLPAETQIALLRVLQEREIERVGNNHPVSVDVRLVAATNRDLTAAVASGAFREDLFYRLNVFPITLPPLRERALDIPVLLEYFVGRYGKKAGKNIKQINRRTLGLFKAYGWPGNIRELQNVVERGVILCEGDTFSVDESWFNRAPTESLNGRSGLAALAQQEVEMIKTALAESYGRISGPSGAAAKLGIPRHTLESKLRRLGISKHGHNVPSVK